MNCLRRFASIIALLLAAIATLPAQDTRTVTQPVIPASCTVLASQLGIVSGEPASEMTFDTARIQAALNACPSGEAVELAPSGSNYAFLIQPITIPSGVTLLVDGGVTVFASRNPADYQVGTPSSSQDTCGTIGTHGNGCIQLISFASGASGSGIMGYGVIDGRGQDKLLVNGVAGSSSWWDLAANYGTGQAQNNFILMYTSKASNLTIYGTTFKNSPMFHLKWNGPNGYTVWDTKIISPWTARNSDGLDISGTNVTVAYSSISDGDDEFAMGSSGSQAGNMTLQYNTTYSGHGVSVGSYTNGGLQNVLVDHVNMAGTAADSNENGLRIKSAADRGGVVQNMTYQNMCVQNVKTNLQLTPFYNTNSGTKIPLFQNIYYHNINFLSEGAVDIEGYDSAHLTTIQLDGVTFQNLQSKDISPTPQNATITLGSGVVYPSLLQTLSGTGVTVTGTAAATNTPWSACGSGTFPYVVGDLFLGGNANNKQTTTLSLGSSVTLNAMVEPAMSQVTYGGTVAAAALTNAVNFLEGSTVVGTGTLGANGTLATASIKPTTTGTHTYTAQYPADSNYSTLNFGSVTVNVVQVGATASSTVVAVTPSSLTFGTSSAITATVTGTAGTAPTGSIQFFDGTAALGSSVTLSAPNSSAGTNTATLNVTLGGGTHNITAAYTGDATYANSTSALNQVTVALVTSATVLKISVASGAYGTSPLLTATVTSTASAVKPTGYVTILDGTTTVGQATLNTSGVATYTATLPTSGAHSYTTVYSGDTNYATSTSSAVSFTVTTTSSTTSISASATNEGYGNSLALTATVGSSAGSTPTGTATFTDGTTTLGTVALNSTGVATYSITLPAAGTHSYAAAYSGDSDFNASSSTAQTVIISKVSASPTLTASPTTAVYGVAETLTIAVTPISGGAEPTGTVTFSDNSTTPSTTLGATTVSTAGTATLSTIELGIGTHSLTASYGGDSNYATATTSTQTVMVVAPFASSLSPTSLTAKIGGSAATLTITLTPPGSGTTSTANLTCASPAKYVSCTVSPASVTLSGTTAVTSTMSVSVASTTSELRRPWGAAGAVLAALLLLPFVRRRRVQTLLVVLAMLATAAGFVGCSSGGGSSSSSSGTTPPTGSLTLTLAITQGSYQTLTAIPLTVTN